VSGTIPTQLGLVPNLKWLYLTDVALCGCFPKQWQNQTWFDCNVDGASYCCACSLNYCHNTGTVVCNSTTECPQGYPPTSSNIELIVFIAVPTGVICAILLGLGIFLWLRTGWNESYVHVTTEDEDVDEKL